MRPSASLTHAALTQVPDKKATQAQPRQLSTQPRDWEQVHAGLEAVLAEIALLKCINAEHAYWKVAQARGNAP